MAFKLFMSFDKTVLITKPTESPLYFIRLVSYEFTALNIKKIVRFQWKYQIIFTQNYVNNITASKMLQNFTKQQIYNACSSWWRVAHFCNLLWSLAVRCVGFTNVHTRGLLPAIWLLWSLNLKYEVTTLSLTRRFS